MALSAQQIPRWFNSIKLNSLITAAQLRNHLQRPGQTLLHRLSAQPQVSSDSCFLQWGLKTYSTSSKWNNSPQFTQSTGQEITSAQSTVLPSVNERSQKIPNFDSELSLEGNSELSEKSLWPLVDWISDLFIVLAYCQSYFIPGKKKNIASSIYFYFASILLR